LVSTYIQHCHPLIGEAPKYAPRLASPNRGGGKAFFELREGVLTPSLIPRRTVNAILGLAISPGGPPHETRPNLATLSLFYADFSTGSRERWPHCAPFGRQPPLRSCRAVRTLSAKGPSSAVGATRVKVRPSDATPSSACAVGGGTGMWAAGCIVLATPLPMVAT